MVEPGQNRKIAALTLNDCVHHLLWSDEYGCSLYENSFIRG